MKNEELRMKNALPAEAGGEGGKNALPAEGAGGKNALPAEVRLWRAKAGVK